MRQQQENRINVRKRSIRLTVGINECSSKQTCRSMEGTPSYSRGDWIPGGRRRQSTRLNRSEPGHAIDDQIGSCSNTTLLGKICICGPISAENTSCKSTVSGAIPIEMNTEGKPEEWCTKKTGKRMTQLPIATNYDLIWTKPGRFTGTNEQIWPKSRGIEWSEDRGAIVGGDDLASPKVCHVLKFARASHFSWRIPDA